MVHCKHPAVDLQIPGNHAADADPGARATGPGQAARIELAGREPVRRPPVAFIALFSSVKQRWWLLGTISSPGAVFRACTGAAACSYSVHPAFAGTGSIRLTVTGTSNTSTVRPRWIKPTR